nr:hypothetical protein B0A51_06866 [Rachicladosporium sp. CCFEE 5018]
MAESISSRSAVELAANLEKGLLDDRQYRVIKLPNQLEALLIHDADTDKASAAMDVNVGSFSDSADMPGIAHAVEHALFMGTKKYPGENEYASYLTKYGGSSNAYTAETSTNYYFEVSASSTSNSPGTSANSSRSVLPVSKENSPLYGALDRFSQFFVNPLFDADTLDRELRAVDSENKKNLQSDNWRMLQLGRSMASKTHPYNRFATGNYDTLHDKPLARGVKIRDEFIGFYKRNYSANRMKLVLLGRESLDELEKWVCELFSDVEDQNLPQNRWDGIPIYENKMLGSEVFVKPVMDKRSLELVFPYPDEDKLYASKPGHYISHLLGYEGPGSILAYIKAKGWANSLSSGAHGMCPGSALFYVTVNLTEEGLKSYREVVKVFFQYVALLKEGKPQEWIVDEMKKLNEVKFKYQQKAPASRTTSYLSAVMQQPFPRDQLLSAQILIREFNPQAIETGLKAIDPDNFMLTVVSKEYPGDWPLKEQWYGTEYKTADLPAEYREELRAIAAGKGGSKIAELHLPGKNEFVPQRLDVDKKEVLKPTTTPKLIRNDANVRTWWKKDDQFWVPKANIHLCLRNPITNVSPFTTLMTTFFKELVDDSLAEYTYDADLAGLSYGLGAPTVGLDVHIGGYNDKAAVLLEKVLISMRDLEVKDDRFAIIKERMTRNLRNFEWSEPFRQAGAYSRWLSQARGWTMFELLEELPSITAADVRAWYPQILRQMHIEMLVQGNLYKEDALQLTNLVEKTLNPRRLPPSQWQPKRAVVLPKGADYRWSRTLANPENINHCIDYILHVGLTSDREQRAKLLLLSQILDEPVFDTLRTKQQLGYVVGSHAVTYNTVQGFRVIIQSERDCEYLESRIEAFLTEFESTLANMAQDEFEKHRVGLINKRLEKLKNLEQEADRLWFHISGETFDFDLVSRDVEHIEPLTHADILAFFREYFLPTSPSRAKATVYLVAQASSPAAAITTSTSSLEEKRDKLTSTLSQLLTQLGVSVDEKALAKQFESLKLDDGNAVPEIVKSVTTYLRDGAKMAEEQISAITTQGQAALGQILPSLGINTTAETNGDAKGQEVVANGEGKEEGKSKTVIIEDVRAWKASLPVSQGATAVRELSEFEELGSKL